MSLGGPSRSGLVGQSWRRHTCTYHTLARRNPARKWQAILSTTVLVGARGRDHDMLLYRWKRPLERLTGLCPG